MKLQHCDKARIYTVEEELVASAEIRSSVDDSNTCLWINEEDRNTVSKHTGGDVLVKFIDEVGGVYPCICRLSELKSQPLQQKEAAEGEDSDEAPAEPPRIPVQCTIMSEKEVVQRRQDVKVSLHMETMASFVDENQELKTVPIVIRDLSAGGMFCISQQKWPEKQLFAAKIFDSVMPVDIEIIRVQPAHSYDSSYPENDPRLGYGCRFLNLGQSSEAELRKFVFQQQLRNRRPRSSGD